MSNTYYEVVAVIDGQTEVMFGSFDKSDCKYEMEMEKDNWKADGYRAIRMIERQTMQSPDQEVYGDKIVTKEQLWQQQAPALNFEYNEDELLELALERGFVASVYGMDGYYLINSEYEGIEDA